MITQETSHGLKCLFKGNLSFRLLGKLRDICSSFCFFEAWWVLLFWIFLTLVSGGNSNGCLCLTYEERNYTVIFVVFLSGDRSLLASFKTYNITNTYTSTQLIIFAANPWTEILCRRSIKNLNGFAKPDGKSNNDLVTTWACFLVRSK